MQGAVFGGFFDGPLKPAPKMKYQVMLHKLVTMKHIFL